MPQDSYNPSSNLEHDELDECVDEVLEKNRSAGRRRHDAEKAKSHSEKTLGIVVARFKKNAADATKEQLAREEKKSKNIAKKAHIKQS